jgi:hypothetical protein
MRFDSWRNQLVAAALLSVAMCVAAASCSRPSTDAASAAKISFGRRQVDQMLVDRPDMAGVLRDDDPVMLWVVAGFNGDRSGKRVYWNADSPASGQPAEHAPSYEGYPPYVRLSGGTDATGNDKWAGVVFELFNLENAAAFSALGERAMAGELDADTYATECVKLEHAAAKKTEQFFEMHPLPGAEPGQNAMYDSIRSFPDSYEEYRQRFQDAGSGLGYDPYEYYRSYYLESLAPYAKRAVGGEETD